MFSDFEDLSDRIIQHGGHGGGYSWESLVKAVLKMRGKKLHISFDCEAGMFGAVSTDLTALREIASIIEELRTKQDLLDQAATNIKRSHRFD